MSSRSLYPPPSSSTATRCTLGYGYSGEGFPSLSGDGKSVVSPPLRESPNSVYAGSATKVVALVGGDGKVTIGAKLSDAYTYRPQNYFKSAVTVDGSAFWLTGVSGSATADAGIRFTSWRHDVLRARVLWPDGRGVRDDLRRPAVRLAQLARV